MAGLFGCFVREARPPVWMRERAERLRRGMTSRPRHRSFIDVRGQVACGVSGPGLLAGNLEPHPGHDGAVLYVEGEVYRAHELLGPPRPGESVWDQIRDRWQRLGPRGLRDLDGLYNLVLYEPASPEGARVSLLNDRYGSRRLYVMERPDAFVFAAELKALVAWPGYRWTLDPAFLEETVCLGSVLGDKTWFREIRLMSPASVISLTADGCSSRRYWSWSELPPPGATSASDRVDALHERWRRAIRARLTPDSMGQQLSGGLDSRLILAEVAPQREDWIAVTYGEPGSDEVRFAARCARHAGRRWCFWALPGEDWLERRVALSLEMDGMLDLANAHHAGLVRQMGELMRFEMSGYLGDLVLGDTWYDAASAEDALDCLAYWESPVSLSRSDAIGRVAARLRDRWPARWTLVDEKCRRATNGWPHLAVNDLEVRKPFMDYSLVEYCAGLPPEDRLARRAHHRLLSAFYPPFAALPYQKTGLRPGAPSWQLAILRASRAAYRMVQPATARAGVALGPWIRGAADVGRWLADSAVRDELTSALTAPGAAVNDHFDRAAVRETLRMALDEQRVAAEVVLSLYRIERYLQHVPSLIASGDD